MNESLYRDLLAARKMTFAQLRESHPVLAEHITVVVRSAGLPPSQPIGTHPDVAKHVQAAHVHAIASLAGLHGPAATAVAQAVPSPSGLDDRTLAKLVAHNAVSAAQARELGFAAAVYELAGTDAALAAAVRATAFPSLGGKRPASTRDLARVTRPEWANVLAANQGANATTAAALARRFAALHPAVAFASRLPPPPAQSSANEMPALVAAYPGLDLTPATAARRIQLVHGALERLGDVRLVDLDLSHGSQDLARVGLAAGNATGEEQRLVLSTLQIFQRVWTLTSDVDEIHALVRAGVTSAVSIARQPFDTFSSRVQLDPSSARSIWEAARNTMADVSLSMASIVDVTRGMFDRIPVGNLTPSAQSYLAQLPGYEQLFGSLSFCDCEECRSILGPAAYFVDVMKYIDDNLRTVFAGHPDHPLDLKTRRPDLWTLELSCDNTDQRIPTLDIVAEVLENYIYGAPLPDRATIATEVYENTLAVGMGSLRQPYVLPLARIASYLDALGVRRGDIVDALAVPAASRAKVELGLSSREVALATVSDIDVGRLSARYGVAFSGGASALAAVDAEVLGRAMSVSRDDLGQLLATTFVARGGAHVTIAAGKRDASSVQNDVEWVTGLTADALDRLQRFMRILRVVDWTIAELDLVLATLATTNLDSAALDQLAALHALHARLAITVPELCALIGTIPRVPDQTSLFDQLFNPPAAVAADGLFPKTPAPRFIHPALRTLAPSAPDPSLPRVLAGLSLDLDDLLVLVRGLAPHLAQETSPGFDPKDPSEAARYFILDLDNLTLLYRHARLARLLGVTVEQLFELLRLLGLDRVAGLADLVRLLDLDVWRRDASYTIDDLATANGQPLHDRAITFDAHAVAADIAAGVAAEVTFKDTLFALALGTTEQASRDVLAANQPALVEKTPAGAWRLTAGVDLETAAVSIPPGTVVPVAPAGTRAVTADDVRGALRPFLVANAFVRRLGRALHMAVDKVIALAALARQSLTADATVKAARGDGPLDPLEAVVAALHPLAVAFADPLWDATAIDFVRTHHALFGTGDLPHLVADPAHETAPYLELSQLRALASYARLARTSSAADLQRVLTSFDAASSRFPATSDDAMSRVLGVSPGVVVGLRAHVAVTPVAAEALEQFARAARIALTLGIDSDALGALASDDYTALTRAADALQAALAARYPDDATRAAKLDAAEQVIRESKRDALVDHLLRAAKPTHWHTDSELYDYFLIDVEAGGCSTTSRLVSATMTAQLYVQRAIMHLEHDQLPPTNPKHIEVGFPPRDPVTGDDPAAEWSWRKNYRVWQANRKVFVWPENYLEPDLRDDKTPLFKELEADLLQSDLDDQHVLDAFTKYLAGFEELGSLMIAGAYHEVRTKTKVPPGGVGDVLHLFGATASDPPTYYYRTCENLIASGHHPNIAPAWSPWQKIAVQIHGRKVSPIIHQGRLHVFWIDIKTRPLNSIEGGNTTFAGYRHKMSLKFTMLRPDGTWSAPQDVELSGGEFGPGRGQVEDRLAGGVATLDPDQSRVQTEALDDYTLSGPNWDWVWPQSVPAHGGTPASLQIRLRNFKQYSTVDLFARKAMDSYWDAPPTPYPQLAHAVATTAGKDLWCGTPSVMYWPRAGWANAAIDDPRIDSIELEWSFRKVLVDGLDADKIASLPAGTELLAVPGSETDILLRIGNDTLMLQGSFHDDGTYVLRRLGSSLVEPTARRLFEEGLDGLLATRAQLAMEEAAVPFTLVGSRIDSRLFDAGTVDLHGPAGAYYRELFFHIPFLIATALNARGRFEAAQRWYHYIFDPTAPTELIDVTGLSPAERAHRLLDRIWRYREFRKLDIERLRDVLTDPAVLALYKRDPFNPWAIARRRIAAFQKAIVMRYVANLLDWADSLFTQFTMESVNEAMMLYTMASEVLGPRPARLGDCGDGAEPSTYATIGSTLDGSHEIFGELETFILGARYADVRATKPAGGAPVYAVPAVVIARAAERSPLTEDVDSAPGMFRGIGQNTLKTSNWGPALSGSTEKTRDGAGGRSFDHMSKVDFASRAGGFGWSFVRQLTPVFCVPVNADLLAYWDRVEDRLFKIRHCMDISGAKRELALFAPPIDPLHLAAMKAAGLGLEDVLGAGSGDLPPYRFLYVLDRAKTFAATLGSFGAALLSALEKKDAEQLNRLRLTQQLNLSRQTTQSRRLDVSLAEEALEATTRQLEAAQLRLDQYTQLLENGLMPWEQVEQVARHVGSVLHAAGSGMSSLAGLLGLLPQIGSPFAMKWGGVELYSSARANALALGFSADVAHDAAVSAGLEGSNARRRQSWTQQKDLAALEIKNLDRQVKAAQIRVDIAQRALDLHETSIDQLQEMLELTDGKFTGYGLYSWLGAQLQRVYRDAYQNARGLAKLAEQAYRFERGDDASPLLAVSHWDPSHAGLFAGEQLLLDLQTLERRFLETNYRSHEVDQTFALSQIDARALLDLRETGRCSFRIDEVFFDLFYPGHYKRRIKAVRLTIPCITGPYTNVSATLRSKSSWIRPTPSASSPLVEVPPSRSTAIATSTAQNDSGVFELSFRDERYMPFEGLGAVSEWSLELPATFRQFDYQTINDVILTISYTAEHDAAFRDHVEKNNAALEGTIVSYLSKTPSRRVLSLRQDFSSAFTRLLRSPAGSTIKLELDARSFPMFVRSRKLDVVRGLALLRTADGKPPAGFTLTVDGVVTPSFASDPTLAGLPAAALPPVFTASVFGEHTIAITSAGAAAPGSPGPGEVAAVDPEKLLDILLYLEYRLA